MAIETYRVKCGGDTMIVAFDGAQASAPILRDGEATQFRVADGRHDTAECIRLALVAAYGIVYETEAEREAADGACSWESVEYEEIEEEEESEEPYEMGSLGD